MMTMKYKNWIGAAAFVLGLALGGSMFAVDGANDGNSAKPQAAGGKEDGGKAPAVVAVAAGGVDLLNPTTAQDWLAVAEKKHAAIKTLTAKVDWLRIQGLLGDEQRRLGTLQIDLREPSKFVVYFNELKFGRRVKKQNKWYIFDGKWLVEKIIDGDKNKKQFFKWQIVPPKANADAAQRNPLAVGQGPFAVPVPVNREVINERFEVSLIPQKTPQKTPKKTEDNDNDEANVVQLRLKPKAKFKDSVKFTEMDIWYHRETLIPMKVRSIDDSENESIFELKEPVIGTEIDKKIFDTTEPRAGEGWEVQITPWGK